MTVSTVRVAPRPRDFVGVRGPDAADLLQRLLSNDVASLSAGGSCDALLLTPKARVIAPLRVLRRTDDDFLLLTEPGLGGRLAHELLRARLAAKAAIEPERHTSTLVLGDGVGGVPAPDYGVPAVEALDADVPGEPVAPEELEALRIRARTPAWGREIDDRVLPAEAGLVERAVSLAKGCFPGQEPVARQHYRGKVNRRLRVLEGEGEVPAHGAELRLGERVVGWVTSAVREPTGALVALAYVRVDVPEGAALTAGAARLRT